MDSHFPKFMFGIWLVLMLIAVVMSIMAGIILGGGII